MAGVRTAAVFVGVLAGLWAFGGTFADGVAREVSLCSGNASCPAAGANPFVMGLAGLLVFASFACLVGTGRVFYAQAVVSVLLGAAMVPNSSLGDSVVDAAFGLVAASFVLSVAAARRRGGFSEQSNPMNLPVFG